MVQRVEHRWIWAICLVTGVLISCGAAPTTEGDTSVNTPNPASVEPTATTPQTLSAPASPIELLHREMRLAANFLHAQYEAAPERGMGCFSPPLALLAPGPENAPDPVRIVINGLQPLGGSIKIDLDYSSQMDGWIEFTQGAMCYGVLPDAPPGSTDVWMQKPVQIPGMDPDNSRPTLDSWTEPNGLTTRTLRWGDDCGRDTCTSYTIVAHHLTEEAVLQVAASLQPLP